MEISPAEKGQRTFQAAHKGPAVGRNEVPLKNREKANTAFLWVRRLRFRNDFKVP